MADSSEGSPRGLSSPENLTAVRRLIRHRFPHDLHDYAIEAICRAADGFHTISVVKTGGGKTTYLSGFMVLLQELDKLPPTHSLKQDLTRSFPKNPVTIVVYPTKGLEEEMEQTFNSLGIPSLAINEDTLKAARRRGEDLWKTAAHSDLRCLLLSPEQLASKQFSALITDKSEGSFFSRIVNLGIDEIHLILSWGSPHFRGAFLEVGNVLMRLPRGTTLIGLTATLAVGNDVERIMKVLGLQPGSFVFARRSNRRPELQFIFCIFGHGIQGWQFPDLKWIIDGSRKTIIYCRTISLAFRLFVYFWHTSTPSDLPSRRKRFRLCCALYPSNYNKKSRDMFVQNPETQILITTDALKVGNDFPNVEDAVSIDPATPEDVLQYGGRAGRKGIQSDPGPRSISYFTKSTLDRAKSVLNGKNQDPETVWESVPEDLGTDGEGKMTVGMARLLLAPCIMAEIDIQFGNPKNEVACTCETCSQPARPLPHPSICRCSGCDPSSRPRSKSAPTLPKASSAPRASSGIPMAKRLNEKMRAYGHSRLSRFRYKIWDSATDASTLALTPEALLPDDNIKRIFNDFAKIFADVEKILPYLNCFFKAYAAPLVEELKDLEKRFRAMSIGVEPDQEEDLATRMLSQPETQSTYPSSQPPPSSYTEFWTTFGSAPVSVSMQEKNLRASPLSPARRLLQPSIAPCPSQPSPSTSKKRKRTEPSAGTSAPSHSSSSPKIAPGKRKKMEPSTERSVEIPLRRSKRQATIVKENIQ